MTTIEDTQSSVTVEEEEAAAAQVEAAACQLTLTASCAAAAAPEPIVIPRAFFGHVFTQSLILALVYLPGIRARRRIHRRLARLVQREVAASAPGPCSWEVEAHFCSAWLLCGPAAMLNRSGPLFMGL